MKRHSEAEIGAMLRQAQQLLTRGQSQAEACKELGVSVMTFHRWRKLHIAKHGHNLVGTGGDVLVDRPGNQRKVANEKQIDEVRAENELLRRIATNLLLEKAKAEERLATIFRTRSFQRN